ncbi:DNA polymerase III subunit beta [Emergencia sp.]|uniref:DNA polymerase III subunit beta n=1 Tax=Emergencia sp. TaxID=1926557 RepID=UPI003AEFA694
MKFECNQQLLTKALNIVSKAVTSRTTIPILKGILLEVSEDGKLKMSASDLDITIEETVEIESGISGSIVVQSKLFGDIIRKLPNATISVELVDTNVVIKCMNSEFSIIGLSADEFPSIKNIEENQEYITFDKTILKEMIRKTSFAASVDESKGVITGILIELLNDAINMVAIDGYRMAITREAMVNLEEKNVIISAKIMNEISKILSEASEEENVNLLLNDKKAIFIIGNVKVVLRLLDGEFIKYKDVLPKDNKIKVKVNRNDLMESIERASLLSKEGKNNLIKFAIKDTIVTITSKSEEGNVREEVIINKEGEDLDIGFNAKYVLDVLKSIDDEDIYMFFNTSITPCLVEPVNGDSFEYLILPVRITNN